MFFGNANVDRGVVGNGLNGSVGGTICGYCDGEIVSLDGCQDVEAFQDDGDTTQRSLSRFRGLNSPLTVLMVGGCVVQTTKPR